MCKSSDTLKCEIISIKSLTTPASLYDSSFVIFPRISKVRYPQSPVELERVCIFRFYFPSVFRKNPGKFVDAIHRHGHILSTRELNNGYYSRIGTTVFVYSCKMRDEKNEDMHICMYVCI